MSGAEYLVELWCQVHTPSTEELAPIMEAFSGGDTRSAPIVKYWSRAYAWKEAATHPERRNERVALGDALLDALVSGAAGAAARKRIGDAILLLELEESLEKLPPQSDLQGLRSALGQLREAHGRERQAIDVANDWSDLA